MIWLEVTDSPGPMHFLGALHVSQEKKTGFRILSIESWLLKKTGSLCHGLLL